jgi:glutathione S-transferase
LELFQAEWCPHSHVVRERLTELGVGFVARQVPAEPEEREELQNLAGTDEIPVLRLEDGSVVRGEQRILAALDERYSEPVGATAHRRKDAEH